MINNLNRLYLSFTNSCNLNCRHCFRSAGTKMSDELSIEEYYKILKSADKEVASRQVSITGGEPFMRKDLFELLDITKEFDLSVDLSTNGILLSEDIIKRLVDYDNIFYMQISVDGVSRDSYEFIRGKGNYDRLMNNLNILKESDFLRQIDLMMIYLVTPQNYMEIPYLPEFSQKYKFDKIAIGEILPFGNGSHKFEELDTSLYMKEIYEGIEKARKKDIVSIVDQFHFGFLQTKTVATPCTAREGKVLAIEPDGNVLACPYDLGISIGNIRDFGYDVKVAYEKAREMTKDIFKTKENLNNCDYFKSCQGGCPLINKRNNTECDERCIQFQKKLELQMD